MRLKEAYERQMKSLLGEAGFFAYLRALEAPPVRGLRLNPAFAQDGPGAAAPFCGAPVPWAEHAYFVREGTRPGLSPLHEGGLFYLQEPSAMTPAAALGARPGERVLDLCAAPGGKSTEIASAMRGEGLLVCNEPVGARAQVLSRNLERMGVTNAVVTSALPEALAPRFPGYFDRVLVDAPCSGEGLFRRQPEAMEEWDGGAPARCAARQLRILDEAARMLRPGGRLVYSTCTFNRTENEEVVSAFLASHPDFSAEPFALPGLPPAPEGRLRLCPHEIPGEGQFLACLRRAEAEETPEKTPEKAPARRAARSARPAGKKAAPPPLPEVFSGAPPAGIVPRGETLTLPPPLWEDARADGIAVLRCGLTVFRVRGNRAEPDHALALAMRPEEAARTAELTEEEAFRYQAGEALPRPGLPAGYTLLCFRGKPLGWGKQADGILKNHYPKGLRRPLTDGIFRRE